MTGALVGPPSSRSSSAAPFGSAAAWTAARQACARQLHADALAPASALTASQAAEDERAWSDALSEAQHDLELRGAGDDGGAA
jgi:hypothetical protein